MFDLPPCRDAKRLAGLVMLCRTSDREDAAQEAWVAHLEGRSPYQAVDTYRVRLMRHARVVKSFTDLGAGDNIIGCNE